MIAGFVSGRGIAGTVTKGVAPNMGLAFSDSAQGLLALVVKLGPGLNHLILAATARVYSPSRMAATGNSCE